MRAGACAAQQTLTTEAASVLKHSLSLARRRGHGQVTPLHVAATLLSSRASLLRRACLKSQPHQTSHPLQCRALELCFNVALNRLPTTPGPLLHGQPSLSNALIAALKRAQAHQRRGCIEQQQQQPLLTIKVELEQLIISILDDPSVSRVMREAGFSSPAVKDNVEDSSVSSVFQCYNSTSAGGVFSSPCSPSPAETQINPSTFWHTHFLTYSSDQNPVLFSPHKKVSNITDSASVKEDIKLVLEVLLRKKRRNTVIVGDSVSITEGMVAELMGRVERGKVPEELKSTHFIKFQFAPVALRFMKKEDVEMNLSELKSKVGSLVSGGEGAIIFTGDIRWTLEATNSPIDHLVAEVGRLLSEYSSSNSKVWLVGTASYQTYMKCQMRQPSLEIQWAFQAVSVPSGGLGLSLHGSSVNDSRNSPFQYRSKVLETKPFVKKEDEDKLICCQECYSNYEKEAQLFKSGQPHKLLPSWLQSHGINSPKKDDLVELRRKWNRFCLNLHQGRQVQNHSYSGLYNSQTAIGKNYSYASSYPWWPSQRTTSISFTDSPFDTNHSTNSLGRFRRQNSCTIEFNFGNGMHKQEPTELSLDSLKNSEGKEVKITLSLGNSLFSETEKSAESKGERTIQRCHMLKKLQENVPWQSESIPFIVEALFESDSTSKETWLLIQGNDLIGKRRLALTIAESIFGSADALLHMNMRDETNPCSEIIQKALENQKKLVVLVEDVDLADTQFMKFLADRFETGNFGESTSQAIFILAKGGDSANDQCQDSVIQMTLKVNEISPKSENKRKAEWEFSNRSKSPRIDEKEDAFNTLDLNIRAEEEDGEFSPISSDLTRETTTDIQTGNWFLESIENSFIFNRNPTRDREMKDVFLSKIKGFFEEVFGFQNTVNFTVEERVLDEMVVGSGSYLNGLVEKWLTDIFQTSLETVKFGGKDGIVVIKLCFGGTGDGNLQERYMGTVLPMKIQVSFRD